MLSNDDVGEGVYEGAPCFRRYLRRELVLTKTGDFVEEKLGGGYRRTTRTIGLFHIYFDVLFYASRAVLCKIPGTR